MAWMQRTRNIIVLELWVLVCCSNGGVGIQTSKNLLDWSHLVNSNEHIWFAFMCSYVLVRLKLLSNCC
jgi:hypothetical protein